MSLATIMERATGRSLKVHRASVPFPDPWGRAEHAPAGAAVAAPERFTEPLPPLDTPAPPHATAHSAEPAPSGTAKLSPPPRLLSLPSRWAIETQRITHLLSLERDDAPRVITLSGLQFKCGVSTVALLLAHHLASAQSDQRILLIDYAVSGAALTAWHHLHFVGSALSWQHFPADQSLHCLSLRGGETYAVAERLRWYRSLILSARQRYSRIIIDTPPLGKLVEPLLLAPESDGIVLILKSGATRKPALVHWIQELQRMGVTVLGSVLTFRQYPLPKWLLRWI